MSFTYSNIDTIQCHTSRSFGMVSYSTNGYSLGEEGVEKAGIKIS